jgi:hypothetical protein
MIGASAKEIIFTSGATESNNMAIKGVAHFYKPKKNLVLVQLCQRLYSEECERRGSKVRFIHVKGHSGDRWNDRADELVQWGKEEGPYSRLRLRRETVSESRERNATWRERLKREKEGQKREIERLPTGSAARAVLGGLPFSFSDSVRLVAGLVLGHRGHALVLVSSLVCQDSHGVQRGGA